MKKSLILFFVLFLVGCTRIDKYTFKDGKYCTNISNKQDIVNTLVLNFEESKVSISNVLSSFNFSESDYEISETILTINGKGLPGNPNETFVLVFELKKDAIVFIESKSKNFSAFSLNDGYIFTMNCDLQ